MIQPRAAFGIEAAAYYLPGPDACVSHWVQTLGIGPQVHEKIVHGGHRRYYPGRGESLATLAGEALQRLIRSSAIPLRRVALLIHAHTMITSVLPPPQSLAAELARQFGMDRARAFSISGLHCGSMIGALRVVHNLMAADADLTDAVIVTADVLSSHALMHRNQTYVHSDAAAALWVRRACSRNRIGAIAIDNCGDFHLGYMINQAQREQYDLTSQLRTLRVIQQAIERTGLEPAQVRKLIPQNVSRPSWRELARRIDPAEDFVFDRNIADKAHACCSDIPINLLDGGFLDPRGDEAVVAVVRGTTGVYAAFTLQAACCGGPQP